MVQRTPQSKLGIQANTTKPEEQRPSLHSLKSSPFRREIPQPGKPPTPPPDGPPVQKSSATPQKQPLVRSSSDGIIPNYMKSTSCSVARKELSPPRRRSSPDTKTPAKAALKRSSSLKVVRTLTKKCSKAVLCADVEESRRATCSSTLKDSKFPQYLTLSPGATEAEGTSAVKVCRYRYCSLNGHRHAPLPPLKCFISARRRSLKMQRSFKAAAEALTPKRQPGNKIETCVDDETDFFVEVYDSEDLHPTESNVNENNEDETETVASAEESAEVYETQSYSSELDDGEAEYSVEKEDRSEMKKNGEICFNFVTIINLNIHVFNDPPMKKDEAEEARPDEDHLSEVSESSQVSDDCLNYDQFSEDEVEEEADAETEPIEETFEEFDGANVVEEETEESTEEAPPPPPTPTPPLDSNHQQRAEEDEDEADPKGSYLRPDRSCQEHPDPLKNPISKNRCREVAEEEEDDRGFNPRDPNFLPLVEEPDSEKVDLRHQMIDERKNSEEWMIDNTLQKVVTKLGSARKQKVALLVEAFEKVRKWENHNHHVIMSPTTTANHHHLMSPSAIQACS